MLYGQEGMAAMGKLTRLLGLASAVGVCAALAAPSVAENLKARPEIGRCVNVGFRGEFRGPKCFRSEPGVGRYSWLSGPGPNSKFTGTFPEPLALETHGSVPVAIKCTSGSSRGEFTGSKALKLTRFFFYGCKAPAKTPIEQFCQNAGSANGEIEGNEVTGEIGLIGHPKKLKVGLDLKPAAGSNLATYECGGASEATGKGAGTGTPYELQGSVIVQVTPLNGYTTQWALTAETKGTAQFPEKLEGGVNDTLSVLAGTLKAVEPATLLARDNIKLEERLELLTRCVGPGC
jgi:hypothetical protein